MLYHEVNASALGQLCGGYFLLSGKPTRSCLEDDLSIRQTSQQTRPNLGLAATRLDCEARPGHRRAQTDRRRLRRLAIHYTLPVCARCLHAKCTQRTRQIYYRVTDFARVYPECHAARIKREERVIRTGFRGRCGASWRPFLAICMHSSLGGGVQ